MKARRRDTGGAGEAELCTAGVADDETSPDTLVPLAGRSEALDLALLARLATAPDDARAAAVRTIATGAETRGWKAAAKEARRILYRFAQRGVAIPPPPAPEAAPRRPTAPALEGYLSPIDGRGDRLVWIVHPEREGGLAVLTCILNEPAGLREAVLAALSRKRLRQMSEDMRVRHGLRMVAADGTYCDALCAQGFERARAAGTPGIGEYPTYRARLVAGDPAPLEPSLATRVLGEVGPDPAALAAGPRLLEEREFVTWPLERATLAPYLEEIAAARESPLLLSRPQQEARVEDVVARARRELFGGAAGAAYRRRLEEMAYYLHATGRPEQARAAAATAAALAAGTRGGEDIPFCVELLRRSLGAQLAAEAERAREKAEGSLIVRPGDVHPGGPPPRPPHRR